MRRAIGLIVVTMLAAVASFATADTPSVVSACPASHRRALVSERAGARQTLVPPGATTLVVCRYNGLAEPGILGDPGFALQSHGAARGQATVQRLASELNALPTPPPYGVEACPADFGTAAVAYFGYPSGPADPVTIALSGCEGLTDGYVAKDEGSVVSQVTGLAPAVGFGTLRGHVELCGGVSPGGCRVSTVTSCYQTAANCTTTSRVAFYTASGRKVGILRLRHARFSTSIPAGRYVVKLLGDGPKIHGKVIETLHTTVPANGTSTVQFSIIVP
jgi:hypothetical protein